MAWQAQLGDALGSRVEAAQPVAGGDINEAYRVTLADRRVVFVKAHARAPAGMFEAEAHGLAWLRGPVRVPAVLAVGEAYLALEWLDLSRDPDHAQLGRALAALHRTGAPCFGLDRDNFLATLPQDNTPAPDARTLWIERRLRPLARRAKLDLDLDIPLERFGPPEPPARLHGDLWWGNVRLCRTARQRVDNVAATADEPVLIDPAVYGGPREIDLAMLALFGGLPDRFVDAYDEVFPLADGWRDRLPLWQLYPLLAHACLFGGGYGAQAARTLARLT
jgi:fructosamine-3-kinase